jgi:hypothetical protein
VATEGIQRVTFFVRARYINLSSTAPHLSLYSKGADKQTGQRARGPLIARCPAESRVVVAERLRLQIPLQYSIIQFCRLKITRVGISTTLFCEISGRNPSDFHLVSLNGNGLPTEFKIEIFIHHFHIIDDVVM